MAKIECKRCGRIAKVKVTEAIRGKTIQFNCKNPKCGVLITFKIPYIKGRDSKSTEILDKLKEIESAELEVSKSKYHDLQLFTLDQGDQIVGRQSRSKQIELPINTTDTTMSRQHFVISGSRDKLGGLCFTIRDDKSKLGTFLNGRKLRKDEEVYLVNNDEIAVGKSLIIFKVSYVNE